MKTRPIANTDIFESPRTIMSLQEAGKVPAEDQIGWFKEKLVQLREQRNKARENIYQLDMDLHQAHRTIHGLSRNLDKSQGIINQLNDQLNASREEVKNQGAKIAQLEDFIARQKKTIKVQSDTISETRDSNLSHRGAQDPRAAIFDRPPPVYNQPQPAYNQPHPVHNQTQPAYNQPHPVHNQPHLVYNQPHQIHNQPHPVYSQPQSVHNLLQPPAGHLHQGSNNSSPQRSLHNLIQPPAGHLHQGSVNASPQRPRSTSSQLSPFKSHFGQLPTRSANLLSTPSRRAGTPSPYSTLGSTPSSAFTTGTPEVNRPSYFPATGSPSRSKSAAPHDRWMEQMSTAYSLGGGIDGVISALTMHDERECAADEIPWPAEFSQFFKLVEEWARIYTNVPNEFQDSRLPEELLASMKRQASDDGVMNFLGSSATRYFLIARLMNTWITNDIFKSRCFLHFSADFDQKFLHSSQVPHDSLLHTRAALLYAVADAAKQMQAKPEFQAFLSSLVTTKVDGMWERLMPLLAPGILHSQAFDDMIHLIGEAVRLGLLMISAPLAYSLEFPKASRTNYFRPDAMINRDPELTGDPQILAQKSAVVRLGITPVVVVTSFLGATIHPRTVHFPNVLLAL